MACIEVVENFKVWKLGDERFRDEKEVEMTGGSGKEREARLSGRGI